MTAGVEIQQAVNNQDLVFIDVRSPEEFAGESIPGAINVPLFTDDQRHRLGLVYKTEGEPAARRLGLELVSPRLPKIVDDICRAAGDKTPLLYCWRGGMRSSSLLQILNMLKIPALRLKGGYRAYRKYIYRLLSNYRIKPELVVLNGLTGVGKTAIIKELQSQGYPAIDLEELANHRGSVFGAIGLKGPRSQKDFESLLLIELNKYQDFPCLVLEGEGTRIGPLHLPRFLNQAMNEGLHILVTAPLAIRAERILKEYLSPELSAENLNRIKQGLLSLEHRLGKNRATQLLSLLQEGDYLPAVQEICTCYYDRHYADSKPGHQEFAAALDAGKITEATEKLKVFLDYRYQKPCLPQKEEVLDESP